MQIEPVASGVVVTGEARHGRCLVRDGDGTPHFLVRQCKEPHQYMRLKLEPETEESISDWLTLVVIIAALLTIPLTIAFWFEVENRLIAVADWTIWSVFVIEYGFYMAISENRWKTTRSHWLSIFIIVFSFPLLHEILKSTRLIRLVRPIPLLRQSAVLRQVELLRLSNVRSAGTQAAVEKAKDALGKDHGVVRWIVRFEYHRSRLFTFLLSGIPFVGKSTIRKRRKVEQEKRNQLED